MAERNILFNFVANTSGLIHGTEQASTAMKKLSKEWEGTVGKLTGPIASLVTGAGLLVAAKKVGELEEKVRRMGASANMSGKQVMQMREQMLRAALATGNSTDEMVGMSQAALQSSKNVKFVSDEMAFMGQVLKVTGGNGEILGETMGKISEKTGLVGKEFETMIGSLYSFSKLAGKEGTFQTLLSNLPKQIDAMKSSGLKPTLQNLALSMFVPKPESLAMALKKLTSLKAAKELYNLGFTNSKTAPELMQVVEALRKTHKTAKELAPIIDQIFGPRSRENITELLDKYDEFGEAMHKIQPLQLGMDAAAAQSDLSSVIKKIEDLGMILADKELAAPLKKLGDAMAKLANDPNLDKYINDIKTIAEVYVGWWATMKLISAGQAAIGLAGGIAGLFGAKGKSIGGVGQLGSMANPMYVRMVGGGGGLPGAGAGAGTLGLLAPTLIALPVVLTALLAYMANKELDKVNSPEALAKRYADTGVWDTQHPERNRAPTGMTLEAWTLQMGSPIKPTVPAVPKADHRKDMGPGYEGTAEQANYLYNLEHPTVINVNIDGEKVATTKIKNGKQHTVGVK